MSMEALALRPKVHLACKQSVVLKGGSRFFGSMDSIPESGQYREGLLLHFLCGQGQMLLLLPGGTNGKGNVRSFVGCHRERLSHYYS